MISRITAALIAGYALVAMAEDTPGALPDPRSTLRYEDEAVQWLPHSVTVIEKDELEATFRRDLEDLESIAPGLIIDRLNTTPRGAAISIRGFGSDASSKGIDPAVAVNLDGVYLGTHTGRLQVLFDFEQVEIARGPQSIFEGDPNLGGSINIQRTRPTGELGVDVRATMGIDQRREMDVVFNSPVAEGVNAKLGVYWRDQGGDYMNNAFNDRDENTDDYALVSGMADWKFRDWFELRYIIDAERSDETSPALLNITAPGELLCDATANLLFPNCRRGVGNPELDSRRATAQNFSNDRQFDGDYHTLRVNFDYGGHRITSITGLRNTDEKVNLDLDASNADFYHVYREQDYEQFSQEITVRGNYSDELDYTVGVYFLNTEYNIDQQEFHILKQLGDAGFSEGHAAGEIQELKSQQQSNLQSVFGAINYTINDHWKADLGIRWSQVERDFEHSPSRIRLGNALSPLRTLLIGTETTKESLVSGGLAYKVDDEAMIYMRYAEGFLPGGFDENAMSPTAGDSYGAETTRSAEIGLKSDWWEDQLRVNVAYFQTQLDNKLERVNAYTPNGNIESVLDNVATVEVSGWEIEITAIPLENLYIRSSYSHMNTSYGKYAVPDLTVPGAQLNLNFLEPERAPAKQLFLSADYSIPVGPGLLQAYAGYRYTDDYQTNPLFPEADVNNWSTWDFSLSYHWEEWRFTLFSQNVKNKSYIQNVTGINQTDILPVTAGTTVPALIRYTEYNQPRYTGLEVTYKPSFKW